MPQQTEEEKLARSAQVLVDHVCSLLKDRRFVAAENTLHEAIEKLGECVSLLRKRPQS